MIDLRGSGMTKPTNGAESAAREANLPHRTLLWRGGVSGGGIARMEPTLIGYHL